MQTKCNWVLIAGLQVGGCVHVGFDPHSRWGSAIDTPIIPAALRTSVSGFKDYSSIIDCKDDMIT